MRDTCIVGGCVNDAVSPHSLSLCMPHVQALQKDQPFFIAATRTANGVHQVEQSAAKLVEGDIGGSGVQLEAQTQMLRSSLRNIVREWFFLNGEKDES